MRVRPSRWTVVPVALVAVAALVALVVVQRTRDDGPGADQASLRVEGSATVTTGDGATEKVTGTRTVDFGDVVTVDDGTATLEFTAGQRYELRSGITGGDGSTADDSEVRVEVPPALLAGDVLVAGGFPAAVRYGTSTQSALGALKVRAGVPLAAAYAGRTVITGTGDLDGVSGLRQVVLTRSASPEPLRYDGTDPWDRRYLGEAIAFGARLEALARGYTSDLAPGPRSASFFQAVLPALAEESEFGPDLLDDRPAGETLVGAAIALQGRQDTFRGRWEAVFSFRDQGAAWGLVAADQGVSSAPVLDSIELAISGPTPTTEGSATSTTTRPGSTTTSRTTDPTDPSTTTTTSPPEDPPPDDPGGPLDPVLSPTRDVIEDVLGALGLG